MIAESSLRPIGSLLKQFSANLLQLHWGKWGIGIEDAREKILG